MPAVKKGLHVKIGSKSAVITVKGVIFYLFMIGFVWFMALVFQARQSRVCGDIIVEDF